MAVKCDDVISTYNAYDRLSVTPEPYDIFKKTQKHVHHEDICSWEKIKIQRFKTMNLRPNIASRLTVY